MLNTTNIMIHGRPIIDIAIDHRFGIVCRSKSRVVPRGIYERVKGIGFSSSLATTFRAINRQKRFHLYQRRLDALKFNFGGQNNRKIFLWDRYDSTVIAMNHGYRATPIPLPRNSPVPKPKITRLAPKPLRRQRTGYLIKCLFKR